MWIDKEGNPSPGWIIINVAGEGEEPRYLKCVNPTDEQYRANGWTWKEPAPPEPVPEPPKKYSKRKIIDALGAEGWAIKKRELEAAGFYDKFVNSTYLCIDDPDFAAYYATLSDEEKAMLEECQYDE